MCVCMCRGHSRDYGTRGVHNTKEMNPHISKVRNMGMTIRKTQSNSEVEAEIMFRFHVEPKRT